MSKEYGSKAEEIADDPVQRQILWLVFNGVPFDIANALDFEEAKAWSVIFGSFHTDRTYNWKMDCWDET